MRLTPESDRLSISEPDLRVDKRQIDRFTIKHLHEYVTVDDLKFYRRRRPPEFLTHSTICLASSDSRGNDQELPNPPRTLNTEYRINYQKIKLEQPTLSLRRATSLRLEGLMPFNRSEHQDCYHWFTPEDFRSCRSFPMRKPESLRLFGPVEMEPEYRSSYITYPMVDRTAKILPREMFRIHSPPKPQKAERKSSPEIEIINKVNEDKALREKAIDQQQECHLQRRAVTDDSQHKMAPSEYRRQFVPFTVEKAHSIPQMSHIRMQGNFKAIPEYQDSFKMYANYAKPEPIIKADNLRTSGSEMHMPNVHQNNIAEYRDNFPKPPNGLEKEKSLKTADHLKPNGEFSKDVPEYYESFRDPHVVQVPEKGKCRESYLHLQGKQEFQPEYKNNYLDFPRARPIVTKPVSTFRLPNSNSAMPTKGGGAGGGGGGGAQKSKQSSPHEYVEEEDIDNDNSSPSIMENDPELINSPEYRKACYNYQIRERSPTHKAIPEMSSKEVTTKLMRNERKSPSPLARGISQNYRSRKTSILDSQSSSPAMEAAAAAGGRVVLKPPKFGRRAGGESALRNAKNCRSNTHIIEGNPKYSLSQRKDAFNSDSIHDSFVVLDNKPCKRTQWMN